MAEDLEIFWEDIFEFERETGSVFYSRTANVWFFESYEGEEIVIIEDPREGVEFNPEDDHSLNSLEEFEELKKFVESETAKENEQ